MDSKAFVLEHLRNTGLQTTTRLQKSAPELTGTELIAQEDYVPDFDHTKQYLKWSVGTVVKDNGQVWQLIQPYDSTIYTDTPENLRAQWSLCHTKDPEKAKPYVAPYGTSGMYMKDECCTLDDVTYTSSVDNNVWKPSEYPDGWVEY